MAGSFAVPHHGTMQWVYRRIAAGVVFSALLAAPVASLAQDDAVCLDCHNDPELEMTFDHPAFLKSAHGDMACIDCHDDLEGMEDEHDKVRKVDCSGCHEDESAEYAKGEHGRAATNGVKEAASCLDCHGDAHAMLPSGNTNSLTHFSRIPAMCGGCHSKPEVVALYKSRRSLNLFNYSNSVHGVSLRENGKHAAVCTDCHGAHGVQKGSDPSSPMFWQNIPNTCGECHEEIADAFKASVHGKAVAAGERDAPVCTDCHGEHGITATTGTASSVSAAHIQETCSQCHASERITSRYTLTPGVVDTYLDSFHGLASQIGGVAAANCASCHGYHDVLPSTDPASSIHRNNLPETCGKCHHGIGTKLAEGTTKIHEPPGKGPGRSSVVNIVVEVYTILIVAVIGGMLVFNFLDFAAKARLHVRTVRADSDSELRMTPFVRIQHSILIITFVLLAYTGFVHKFPDAFWSWPFQVIENGSYWRGLIHRIAGWIFTGLFLVHIVLLIATARGRAYLEHLQPKWHDAVDAWRLFRKNAGMGGPGPTWRRFNFAEKAEYWAMIWGSVLMIASGVMLIYTSAVLRLLPEVWLEVAQVVHLYEAVLASLAIVVWHFYWVIFDPHEYPMNTAWVIGKKKASRHTKEDETTD